VHPLCIQVGSHLLEGLIRQTGLLVLEHRAVLARKLFREVLIYVLHVLLNRLLHCYQVVLQKLLLFLLLLGLASDGFRLLANVRALPQTRNHSLTNLCELVKHFDLQIVHVVCCSACCCFLCYLLYFHTYIPSLVPLSLLLGDFVSPEVLLAL